MLRAGRPWFDTRCGKTYVLHNVHIYSGEFTQPRIEWVSELYIHSFTCLRDIVYNYVTKNTDNFTETGETKQVGKFFSAVN
jgi:hypothetical protein